MTFRNWADRVERLGQAIRALEPVATELRCSPIRASWYGGLYQMLLPQLAEASFLVVAVVGGTNTGKSTIFNHLAGQPASRVHPRATQTKHPVCILPRGFVGRHDVGRFFPDFEIRPWSSESDALADDPGHLLIVREDPTGMLPDRFILLDTPDVDGALKVNWERARLVRDSSDVLVGLLTQEKYNDSAIRDFFRGAASADKVVALVFNMIEWPDDIELCREFLQEFIHGTGIQPLHVYAAPRDREAVKENQLSFHPLSEGASIPQADLSGLQFDTIKIRTFRGALRQVLNKEDGLPTFLDAIARQSQEYKAARDLLQAQVKFRFQPPKLPSEIILNEVWSWLEPRRTRLDRAIHGFYGTVSTRAMSLIGSITPFRRDGSDPTQNYMEMERKELSETLARVLNRLDDLRRGGNDILRGVLETLLEGAERRRAFEKLEELQRGKPLLSEAYHEFVKRTLDQFERDHPSLIASVKWSLVATAVIRPVITIALFGGPAVAADLAVSQASLEVAQQAAIHTSSQLAGELAFGTAVSVGAEGVLAGMKKPILGLVARLFSGFYEERSRILTEVLDRCVLGSHLERIDELAGVPQCESFLEATRLTADLAREIEP